MAIEDYTEASCRQVANDVLIKLLRELRDMVYEYLIPEQVTLCTKLECSEIGHEGNFLHIHGCGPVDNTSNTDSEDSGATYRYIDHRTSSERDSSGDDVEIIDRPSLPDRAWTPSAPRTRDDYICPEHYWRDDVLGTQNARELIECFYKKSKFSITTYTLPDVSMNGCLEYFLRHDHFGLGVRPKRVLGSIILGLTLTEFGWAYGRCEGGTEWHINSNDRVDEQDRRIQTWIEDLHRLSKTTRVVVQLTLDPDWIETGVTRGIVVIDRAMKLLLPELAALRRAGHQITVEMPKIWQNTGTFSVFEKWVHRLDHEASKGNDDFPSVVDSDEYRHVRYL